MELDGIAAQLYEVGSIEAMAKAKYAIDVARLGANGKDLDASNPYTIYAMGFSRGLDVGLEVAKEMIRK